MACYVPSAQYEGVRHILRDAGSETRIRPINPASALEVLEGQVALVHHIMAFEESQPQRSTFYHLAKSGRPVFWPIS